MEANSWPASLRRSVLNLWQTTGGVRSNYFMNLVVNNDRRGLKPPQAPIVLESAPQPRHCSNRAPILHLPSGPAVQYLRGRLLPRVLSDQPLRAFQTRRARCAKLLSAVARGVSSLAFKEAYRGTERGPGTLYLAL